MKLPFKLPTKAEERNKIIGPLIGAALALVFSLLFITRSFTTLENFDLDLKFKLRQNLYKVPTNKDILNVFIDDATLTWEGAYPDDPQYYTTIIDMLGVDKANALATVFSIDYSRPFGRKVDVSSQPMIAEFLGSASQMLLSDVSFKGGLLENIKGLSNSLAQGSPASSVASSLDSIVFSEQFVSSSNDMQNVAGFAEQIKTLDPLAPNRETLVGASVAAAKNVYFTYEASDVVPTKINAKKLKTNSRIRKTLETVLKYPTSNRPDVPAEGVVFDAYHNMSVSDFDYMLGKEDKPFTGEVADRIKRDREFKADEVENFKKQNMKISFDLPKGLENAYMKLGSVSYVVPEIGEFTAGQGPRKAEFTADDGTLRMVAPVYIYNGRIYPHMDLLLAMKYLRVAPKDVVFRKSRIILKNATHPRTKNKSDVVIPLLPGGTMLINWAGVFADTTKYEATNLMNISQNFDFYTILKAGNADPNQLPPAYLDVYNKRLKGKKLAKEVEEYYQKLKNRIVIIGLTAEGTADMNPTPLEARYKVIGLHANVINTIVENLFIKKMRPIFVVLSFFILSVGLGYAGSAIKHQSAAIVAGLNFALMLFVALISMAISNILFIKYRIIYPDIIPLILIVLTFMAVFFFRYFTEEQEKKKMKGMFATYVNPQVVDTLIADPDKLKLGGERTRASVFFSDIAGFTSISETLTPEALVELLNEYLTAMTNILLSYGGTLDKYIGDAIVGIFGAPIYFPEHARNCCFNALDMQAKIAEMRVVWKEQGKHLMQVRCGINTGEMIAGNMGSKKRFNYTVIGPEVDYGEHMESSGKLYATQTTISEFTRAEADDDIITRLLDISWAEAYPKPVKIYELMAKKKDGYPEIKLECMGLHEEAVVLFFQRQFEEALKKTARIHELFPENKDDEIITKFLAPTFKFEKRVMDAIKNQPDENFDRLIKEATHRKNLIF